MPKVIFTISYSIKPELREEYLALAREMRRHLTATANKNYSVYEAKNKKNHFTEVFITSSLEEYESLEDNMDEKTHELVSRLERFIDNGGMKYATLIESE